MLHGQARVALFRLSLPGSIPTFFEYPGAAEGRAGAGMIHRIVWRAATPAALEFWAGRLVRSGVLVAFAHEMAGKAGATQLRQLGVTSGQLPAIAGAVSSRLQGWAGGRPVGRAEIEALLEDAF